MHAVSAYARNRVSHGTVDEGKSLKTKHLCRFYMFYLIFRQHSVTIIKQGLENKAYWRWPNHFLFSFRALDKGECLVIIKDILCLFCLKRSKL